MKDRKKYIEQFKSGTNTMFKEFFNKETNKKQRANMWTFSRLIISFIIPILTIIGKITASPVMFGMAVGTTAFGALTDFFDGRSARKHGSASEFGKFLDPIADKIFSMMIGLSLAISNPLFLINLIGEATIAATNITYQSKYDGIDAKSILIGKIKQWPLSITFILGFLSAFFPGLSIVTDIAILATFILQLATIGGYIHMYNKEIKKWKRAKKSEIVNNINNLVRETEKENTLKKSTDLTEKELDLSKKEQYINLRNILNEIINMAKNEAIDIKTYKKTK